MQIEEKNLQIIIDRAVQEVADRLSKRMESLEETCEERFSEIKDYSLLSAKSVLTFDEVALLTGLSKSFLYQLTSQRKIPYFQPNGKRLYFDRGEVEAWLKQNRKGTELEAEQEALKYVAKRGGVR